MSYTSRLNSTQLNSLNLSNIVNSIKEDDYTIETCSIEKNRVNPEFVKISEKGASVCVFSAVSDKRQQQNLAFINEVIQQFEKDNSGQETTLLIPLMQSRFWKKHCVLVEVTVTKDGKKINIHDSQSWWRNLFYPNCLKDLKKQGYKINYTNYAKQKDNYSCAYFVYHYIKTILENGSEGLKNIFVSLNSLKGEEEDPIGKKIQDNFKSKYPGIKIESGEDIPWDKQKREKYFEFTRNLSGHVVRVVSKGKNPEKEKAEESQNHNKNRETSLPISSENGEASINRQELTHRR